jgi:arylsulfatase A-like enzyme
MTRLLAIVFSLATAAAFADARPRPNVLFIFTDDHAQHALSCYGSKVNQTPHLDRLASGGTRFTNAFVTNSICTPSRATLLTGQACRCSTVSTAAAITSPSVSRPVAITPA